MNQPALPENPPIISSVAQRFAEGLGRVTAAGLGRAFAMALAQGNSYALLPLGVVLAQVDAANLEIKRTEAYSCGRPLGRDNIWLLVKPQAVRYAPGVLDEGYMGAVSNGIPNDQACGLKGKKQHDLCNVFFALARNVQSLTSDPVLLGLNDRLRSKNLKCFVTVAASGPGTPGSRDWRAELALAVSLIDKNEPALFNRTPHELATSDWPYSDDRPRTLAARSPAAALVALR